MRLKVRLQFTDTFNIEPNSSMRKNSFVFVDFGPNRIKKPNLIDFKRPGFYAYTGTNGFIEIIGMVWAQY